LKEGELGGTHHVRVGAAVRHAASNPGDLYKQLGMQLDSIGETVMGNTCKQHDRDRQLMKLDLVVSYQKTVSKNVNETTKANQV
jgi:hypothetical protein